MRALVVGISGASCSGKTTLARLLRDIWPRTTILHEDDFYWTDNKIPVKNGIQDWDCLEALDLKSLESVLQYIRDNGVIPPDWTSKEDQNSVGECDVNEATVQEWKDIAKNAFKSLDEWSIVIIDAFLLYPPEMEHIWRLLDARLFISLSFELVKKRREARSGYVTLEGFWEDPPGYVEDIVWPNYVKDHSFLFVDGDVEGKINEATRKEMDLRVIPNGAEADMTLCLAWACKTLHECVDEISKGN